MAMKYEVVADDLFKKIQDGTYTPNEQLPTIEELCDLYSVSKITVKKALDRLEVGGVISRRRGSGSFVKNVMPMRGVHGNYETSSQMPGFKSEHEALGQTVTSQVIEFQVVRPREDVAQSLAMDQDQFAYHIIRVRLADGVPRAIEYTYMPIDTIPNLRLRNVEGSIYSYIEDELGLKVASAHRIIRAVLPTQDELSWLKVKANSPLLEVEQVTFLDDGTPFEYSISRHPNGYEFRSISTK